MTSNARELAQIPVVPGGRRNLIINGAMAVSQRRNITNNTTDGEMYGPCDRWLMSSDVTPHNLTFNRPESAPAETGLLNSLNMINNTATDLAGNNERTLIITRLEGQDVRHLGIGNAFAAQPFTLSFWAQTSLPGNYMVYVRHIGARDNNTENAVYFTSYTIENTGWNRYEVNIPANPNVGRPCAFDEDAGLEIVFVLDAGEGWAGATTDANLDTWVNQGNTAGVANRARWHNSSGANFGLVAVQLEAGIRASEFEYRFHGEELALCKRYYQLLTLDERIISIGTSDAQRFYTYQLPVEMRTDPDHTVIDLRGTTNPGGDTNGHSTHFQWRTTGVSQSGWGLWSLAYVILDAEL